MLFDQLSVPTCNNYDHPLDDALRNALRDAAATANPASLDGLCDQEASNPFDALLALLRIHDLHTGPIAGFNGTERFQHHPLVATLKWQLEDLLLQRITEADTNREWHLPADPVEAMRAIVAAGREAPAYRYLAEQATEADLLEFLALEGGPDGGFDDLVAICQVGLDGEPKLELARNYWDEMGRGSPDDVHTNLYRQLIVALDLPSIPRAHQPIEALERAAFSTLLATNRWLQPEMVGALGLIELEAGPRCRKVIDALRRLELPLDALPFYEEHATTDPRHGKQWLDRVVLPLAEADPDTGRRIVQGARWRSVINKRFFEAVSHRIQSGTELVQYA